MNLSVLVGFISSRLMLWIWEVYQNPKKHIMSFLRGIPLFALIAAIVAGILTLI